MASIPLTALREGQSGTVAFIRGGMGAVRRLTDMGLTPGTRITVIECAPFGPVEISVRGSRLAIGRGMAIKVFVEVKR